MASTVVRERRSGHAARRATPLPARVTNLTLLVALVARLRHRRRRRRDRQRSGALDRPGPRRSPRSSSSSRRPRPDRARRSAPAPREPVRLPAARGADRRRAGRRRPARTGLLRSIAGLPTLWFHIAFALALVPLLVWHLVARRVRPRRRTTSPAGSCCGRAWLVGVAAAARRRGHPRHGRRRACPARAAGSPARTRRRPSTRRGSRRRSGWRTPSPRSTPPAGASPSSTPAVAATSRWQELTAAAVRRRALLDCTSGWYSRAGLGRRPRRRRCCANRTGARSLLVHAVTGYWVRFPLRGRRSAAARHRGGRGRR